jgi:hypothetical protein
MEDVMRALALLLIVVTVTGATTGGSAAAQTTASEGFELVGHSDLGARGMNAGLAIAGDCAYVGSRSGDQGTLILDIDDPAAPAIVGEISQYPGSTPREVRAVASLDLLVILNYRLDPATATPNTLDVYDISDCRKPALRGQIDFGDSMPHEFFLWRDPSSRHEGRVLAYVTMWGHAPNLRVVDVSDRSHPVEVASWDAAPLVGIASRIHSLSVSPDGKRAYVADWDNGLFVLDTTALARGSDAPTPQLLTPPERWLQFPGGNLHSAVYIPGRDLVVTTQEIYGAGACPYGQLHVVDVADPTTPVAVGSFGIAENDPNACGATAALDGAFTTHNPLVFQGLAFVSWYAGGLRALELSRASSPRQTGVFVPDPLPSVRADDLTLGSYPVRMWSYPIVRDGLVYVVDIRNGLYVLRYTGRGASKIADVKFAEGNAT